MHGVVDVRRSQDAVEALDTQGLWAVTVEFEGAITAVRFARAEARGRRDPSPIRPWEPVTGWTSSVGREDYVAAVGRVRELIAAGEVYQVNVCRILQAPLSNEADLDALAAVVAGGNPAPFAGRVRCASAGLDVVCASPELFLARRQDRIRTGPIKGTAPTAATMLAKDHTENVMIVDLVRNDLSRICRPGSVEVEALCAVEDHPGLTHLVSTVAGDLRPGTTWRGILAATTPPGSVSGAPKSAALRTITTLEPTARGPYCGAIGWVDADRGEAEFAVGIRTFWATGSGEDRRLNFGTGAGITWDSAPVTEWEETELKARRLIGLAS